MPPRSLLSSVVLAGVAAAPLFTAPSTANAQGLIDFLWGGGQEWGGSRQTVEFSSQFTPGQIIVSFGDRRLYLVTRKGQAISYPIAVPREQSRWQGTTSVSDKRVSPSWRPTPDMLKENPKLPSWVPGGHPMNPLGVRAMYLGASTYRIHGTDAPWTIGQAVSKGCIRMFNEDVLDLYPRVPVGMKVTVTWQRFSAQAVASSSGYEGAAPHRYGLSGYVNRPRGRALRPLEPMPPIDQIDELEEAQTAAVRMDTVTPVAASGETPRKRAAKPSTESSKSGDTSKAAETSKSAGSGKPTEASKSTDARKLAGATKPAGTSKTAEPAKAASTSKAAADSSKAADASKSADAAKPTDSKAADAPKSIHASKPADTSKAAEAPKTADTSKSADTAKPAKTAEVKPAAKKPEPQRKSASFDAATGAVEAAQKAADAATRAAEAAREAAEAAKKAAADAKKATSAGNEPEKAPAKSAAL